MAQQLIGVGAVANDGTGDDWRTALIKVNANETELFTGLAASYPSADLSIAGNLKFDGVTSHTMEFKGDLGNTHQIGQENLILVVNKTGVTINEGQPCFISGYDSITNNPTITLADASSISTAKFDGLATTTMIDDQVGLITALGRVNDLDTSSFTAGVEVYVSETAGQLTTTKPDIILLVGHIGKSDVSTGYVLVIREKVETSIYGGFSDSGDQTFTANVSSPINFNSNDEISGITHSESVDNEQFTFDSGGVYQATAEPQYERTAGGGTDVLNMYLQKDTGGGFANVTNSNVKFSVNTASNTTVSPLTGTFRVDSGDKIRFMIQVESTNLQLTSFAASGIAPNDIPATPSIIMNIVRIGD